MPGSDALAYRPAGEQQRDGRVDPVIAEGGGGREADQHRGSLRCAQQVLGTVASRRAGAESRAQPPLQQAQGRHQQQAGRGD
jgi:hypothetical protein